MRELRRKQDRAFKYEAGKLITEGGRSVAEAARNLGVNEKSAAPVETAVSSMSGSGNCYDNAIGETFFHTLKTELVYLEGYGTGDEAGRSIFEYSEVYDNRQRRHLSLNHKSPIDFERLAEVA